MRILGGTGFGIAGLFFIVGGILKAEPATLGPGKAIAVGVILVVLGVALAVT
jgi:hypothetical protein